MMARLPTTPDESYTGRTLVLGLGNLMLGDQGAGIELIHRLRRRRPRLPGLDLLRAGSVNVSLANVIGHYRHLLVVTTQALGLEPGTVRELGGADMDFYLQGCTECDPAMAEVFALLRRANLLPSSRTLLVIQPAGEHVGRELSPAVEESVARLVERIASRAVGLCGPASGPRPAAPA